MVSLSSRIGADLAGDPGDLPGEGGELVDHHVDGLFELEDLASGVDGNLLSEVAVGDCGGDLGDVADLVGQVGRHQVDVLGEPAPGSRDPFDAGLAAELALGADLTGDAGHLAGEGGQLVDHRVDGLGQCGDLALGLDRDLLGQVAVGDGCGDLGDVADLGGEVAGHEVDRLGEPAPGAGDAFDAGLAAELAFGADLAGDAGDLVGEGGQLVDHRVDGLLEFEDLALHVDGDLLGQVAVGDGCGDLGDVADLVGEVAGHGVDAVGEVFPGARHAGNLSLTAELAFGADLTRDATDLGRERPQLVDHRVDRGADAQELALDRLALDLERHLLGQVALGDGHDDAGHFGCRPDQVVDQQVDRLDAPAPVALVPCQRDAFLHLALAADHGTDADELVRHLRVGLGEIVVRLSDVALHACPSGIEAHGEVARTSRREGCEQVPKKGVRGRP